MSLKKVLIKGEHKYTVKNINEPKRTLSQKTLDSRVSVIFSFCIIAADVPRSLKMLRNPMTIKAIPTKPKSSGTSNLARMIVVMICKACLPNWEKPDHLIELKAKVDNDVFNAI